MVRRGWDFVTSSMGGMPSASWWLPRPSETAAGLSGGRPSNKHAPAEYFERFHHVIGLDESLLEFVLDRYGVDKFLIGTDYPHPDAHMNVAKAVDGLTSISDETRHALTWGNAQRFFGLPDSVATGQPLAPAGE